MPIISALPNDDCPGTALIRASSGSAMLIQMAAAGTSDTMVEIAAVPTMNASTTRRLSLPGSDQQRHREASGQAAVHHDLRDAEHRRGRRRTPAS